MRALALAAALLVLAPATVLAAAAQTTLPDVEDEVMCVACGTALNISQAPSADRERAFIRRRIAEGLDKQQIKDALVAEYGPKVLAEPRQSSAWLIPVALAALALLAVALTVRRWRRAAATPSTGSSAPAVAADDAARLERDMATYDL
jgi:cytochrome c-type biogenesis protein CcmH